MAEPAEKADGPAGQSDVDILTSMNVAFELSALAMFLVDESLHIVQANPVALQMLGPEPLIGRSVIELSVAANIDRTKTETTSWINGDLVHLERETELLGGDGETLSAVLCADAIVLPSGRRYFLAQLRDVTAERRQAIALTASAAQYRQLAENIPDSSVMLFDHDLRLTVAAGEALAANGYSNDIAGQLMYDIFPAAGMDLLEGPYRNALAGRASDFTYVSPVGGRVFRGRARPIFDGDGEVVGGLSVMEDVTADQSRAIQLEQARQYGHFGGSHFDQRSGWVYDDALLELWGIRDPSQADGLPFELVSPDGRAGSMVGWRKVLTESGPHSLSYSIIHGATDVLRHLQCTASSIVDADGVLLQVVATHVDVTDAVVASLRAELEQTAAADERSRLLRKLGDMLATSRLGLDELLRTIVDLATGTVGEGAAIRILSPDHRTVERDVIAHPDESVRLRLAASLRRSAEQPVPEDGIIAQVVLKGKLLSDSWQQDWRPEYQEIFTERVFDQAAHMMVAPIRHNGSVLGKLAVFRTNPDAPYQAGEDAVLQVLADGAGVAIAENRAWQKADLERDDQLAGLRQQHLELLEKLAGLETRERTLLAEAIHDEPIQRIVAGILRLDHLSSRIEPAPRAELNGVIQQLASTVDWLRNLIVVALTPPDLSGGLGPALARLAQSIFTGTSTVFVLAGLDRVPLNLLANEAAYRIFREALGNVRKHAKARNVTLRLEQREGLIVISLTDDGVGSLTLDAGAGHLGMATMRARADAEGGDLQIESVVDLGTVVTLSLPVLGHSDVTAPTVGLAAQTRTELDFLRTVVVCDDHQYLRDAVKLVLSNVPRLYVVGEASDGPSCLEQVRYLRPDVLVLDVSMPGGGPQLAAAAKRLRPEMYIIVFSGRQDENVKNAMLAAGADQYLVKTGRLQPLAAALNSAMNSAQAHRSSRP